MKITGFYVTKKGNVIDEKVICRKTIETVRDVAVMAIPMALAPQVLEIIQTIAPTMGIVAQASPLDSDIATIVLTTGQSSISKGLEPIIQILQDLAEPVSYCFAIRGLFLKMSGEDKEGMRLIKAAIGGWFAVQYLPQLYKIFGGIQLY